MGLISGKALAISRVCSLLLTFDGPVTAPELILNGTGLCGIPSILTRCRPWFLVSPRGNGHARARFKVTGFMLRAACHGLAEKVARGRGVDLPVAAVRAGSPAGGPT